MGELQGRGIVCKKLILRRALIIQEKRVLYVVSWITRITRIDVGPHKRILTHVGLSAHAHNIVQEVEVHGWLLSGIEELTITLLLFFDSCS